ncbi:MAG: hypothetical protein ACRDSR_04610 [Pseudonocardiaceae bacterium]
MAWRELRPVIDSTPYDTSARHAPICEQLSPEVTRRFICCPVGSHYHEAVIPTDDLHGPRAGMPDPPGGVVLPVGPDDASRYGWRIRPAVLRTPHRRQRFAPALGAS